MTVSDIIEIVGIVVSTIVSIIAIVISVKTLKQNNKMIEDSTRPCISIYSQFVDGRLYIITKNFGSTPCVVDYIKSDMNITREENQAFVGNPFDKATGAIIPPNGKITCELMAHSLKERKYNFEIKYHSSTNSYLENICLNIDASSPFPQLHSNVQDVNSSLSKISRTLEDVLKTKL